MERQKPPKPTRKQRVKAAAKQMGKEVKGELKYIGGAVSKRIPPPPQKVIVYHEYRPSRPRKQRELTLIPKEGIGFLGTPKGRKRTRRKPLISKGIPPLF